MKRTVSLLDLHRAGHVASQAVDDALGITWGESEPVHEWEFSAVELAHSIAHLFFPVTSLSHTNLRRNIAKIIENERCVCINVDSNSSLCSMRLCFCPLFGEHNCAIILNSVSASLTLQHLLHEGQKRTSQGGGNVQ